MLQEDPERTHVAADPDRIAALYEATNQPLVQPAGRAAQAAKGAVLALAEEAGYEVLVALSLADGENVIYAAPEPVSDEELPQVLEEALDFAESMGFILDATEWSSLDEAHKAELIGRIPVFSEPAPLLVEVQEITRSPDPTSAVARLLAAFCALLVVHCGGMSAEQRAQAADIHQQLGDNLLAQGDAQQALREYLQSLGLDETPEAHNGIGLIYGFSLGRPEDAEKEFKRAIEMRPDYAEAMTNLSALYLARGRFADAIPPLEKAARDPLYKARVLAQSNLGWALHKSGQTQKGIAEIKGALAVAPRYCLGWRQLGTIYSERGRVEDATASYAKYVEACPDVADAHLLLAKALVRQSKAQEARAEFERCAIPKDAKEQSVASECARYLRDLGKP